MAFLGEYAKEHSYLDEGWHSVRVIDARMFEYNSGSAGVEFTLADDRDRRCSASFCLKETILWRLADFAQACGMTADELAKYDTQSLKAHKKLVGMRVQVLIQKVRKPGSDKAFKDVVEFEDADASVPEFNREDELRKAAAAESSTGGDDCPF